MEVARFDERSALVAATTRPGVDFQGLPRRVLIGTNDCVDVETRGFDVLRDLLIVQPRKYRFILLATEK